MIREDGNDSTNRRCAARRTARSPSVAAAVVAAIIAAMAVGADAVSPLRAAEFDINAPLARLRQYQPCERCGLGLVVNGLPTGAGLRCAACRHVQRRWADRFLVSRMYQGCPRCGALLDASEAQAGEWADCGGCEHPQQVLPEVAGHAERFREANRAALAHAREFLANRPPPGTGEAEDYNASVDSMNTAGPVRDRRVPRAASPADRLEGYEDGDAGVPVASSRPAARSTRPSESSLAATAAKAASAGAPSPIPVHPSTPAFARSSASSPGPVFATDAEPASRVGASMANHPAAGPVTVPAVTSDMFLEPEERAARMASARSANEAGPAARRAAATPPAASMASGADDPAQRSMRPVARVNDEAIPEHVLDASVRPLLASLSREMGRVAELPEGRELLAKKEKDLRAEFLDALIDRVVARQAAERMGLDPDEAEIQERWDELRRQNPGAEAGELWAAAREEALLDALRRRLRGRGRVGPEAIRRHYREHIDEFVLPAGLSLRGLVIFRDRAGRADPRPAEVIADELAGRLERGGRFAELSAIYDELPGAAAFDGGEADAMPPEEYWSAPLRAAFDGARPGAVAGPVETANALVFARLERRRAEGPASFEAVAPRLREVLERAAGAKRFEEWLRRERTAAEISIAAGN